MLCMTLSFVDKDENGKSGKPVFGKPLSNIHCKDGDAVTLECEVTGSPRPQISWYKGTTEILDSQVKHFFVKMDNVIFVYNFF